MNALVLGGSRGVGLATSELLATKCNNLCIVSRSEEHLAAAMKSLGQLNANVYCYKGDVSDSDFAAGLNAFLNDANFGTVDVLVCNAGGPPQKVLLETTEADWNLAIQTSLLGQIRVIRNVIPEMVKSHFGRIICISSTLAKEPSPSMILSATARAGMSAFVKALSSDYAKFNITINAICLGGVLTERMESLIEGMASKQGLPPVELKSNIQNGIPAGRFASAGEIAHYVDFLASPMSGYITGTSIVVDGGVTKSYF